MRYCTNCRHITTGQPLFCNFCGRSYNLRLCPHRHPNPRNAAICSQCGSRELSTPQPRRSAVVQILAAILTGFFSRFPKLAVTTLVLLFIAGMVNAAAGNPRLMAQVVLLCMMFGLIWYLYMLLPAFLRRFISRLFRRSKKDKRDDHGH